MIFVSAGHSSNNNGASFEGKFYEHREAVIWRDTICSMLDITPVPIGSLRDKIDYINKHAHTASVAIEIHFNAAVVRGEYVGKGCETLYHPSSGAGKGLATKIQNALLKSFSPDRGIKEGYYRMNPKNKVDYFLAKTKCPAIIIEPDFVHRYEVIQYARDTCCRNIAKALACWA